jgi:GT2 family glycosyltransferase
VGPKIYFYSDSNRIQSAGAKICWNKGVVFLLRSNQFDNKKNDDIINVDYVSGCALLAKTELFKKIGYLNQNYFAYWEETDWCIRAHKATYKVLCVPQAKIWHKVGSSSSKTSGFYEYHMTRNMFWFMRQHATRKQYISFLLYFFIFNFWFKSAIYLLHNNNLKQFTSFCDGVRNGFKKLPENTPLHHH